MKTLLWTVLFCACVAASATACLNVRKVLPAADTLGVVTAIRDDSGVLTAIKVAARSEQTGSRVDTELTLREACLLVVKATGKEPGRIIEKESVRFVGAGFETYRVYFENGYFLVHSRGGTSIAYFEYFPFRIVRATISECLNGKHFKNVGTDVGAFVAESRVSCSTQGPSTFKGAGPDSSLVTRAFPRGY